MTLTFLLFGLRQWLFEQMQGGHLILCSLVLLIILHICLLSFFLLGLLRLSSPSPSDWAAYPVRAEAVRENKVVWHKLKLIRMVEFVLTHK